MPLYLGIDVGGTHTDAVLCGHVDGQQSFFLSVKVKTQAQSMDSVALSIQDALQALEQKMHTVPEISLAQILAHVQRVTISTTLGLNALVQGKGAPVGLVYSAGPGMDAQRFLQDSVMGQYAYKVEGGLDHRGCEVTALNLTSLAQVVCQWQGQGVRHFAVAGKFSVRNTAHENAVAQELMALGIAQERITLSHTLSGQLNFPRRMAAAYINASIQEVQQSFLQAVQEAVHAFMQQNHAQQIPPIFMLKADGGAIRLSAAMATPLYTVLSGPAASVMGAMALGATSLQEAGDALLLDVGGTTTDMALYAQGLPVLDAVGMHVAVPVKQGQESEFLRTPLRSLATLSLSLGGDTPLLYDGQNLHLGTVRQGPAMAFGGDSPTLVDALVYWAQMQGALLDSSLQGNASQKGLEACTQKQGRALEKLVGNVITAACEKILHGIQALLTHVADRPVYTLAQLLEGYSLHPTKLCLVGGPAVLLRPWLEPILQKALGLSVHVPSAGNVANALGAAVTLPTDHVQLLADTLQGYWSIPTLGLQGTMGKNFTVKEAQHLAMEALQHKALREGTLLEHELDQTAMDVVEAESFATLDEYGRGGKDIRVQCQWRPGIVMPWGQRWE